MSYEYVRESHRMYDPFVLGSAIFSEWPGLTAETAVLLGSGRLPRG